MDELIQPQNVEESKPISRYSGGSAIGYLVIKETAILGPYDTPEIAFQIGQDVYRDSSSFVIQKVIKVRKSAYMRGIKTLQTSNVHKYLGEKTENKSEYTR